MGGYAVKMDVDVEADPEIIRELITTTEGIARWWSSRTGGDAARRGGRLHVGFPDRPQPFELEVVEVDGATVAWHVDAVPEWWAGTMIRLSVEPTEDGGSTVHFEHGGFDAENPSIPIITPAWAQILFRMKAVAEGSAERPFFDF